MDDSSLMISKSVLDYELVTLVSNPESDKITRKLVSNHILNVSTVSQCPKILTWPTKNILVGIVKDVDEMGIDKRSKAFAHIFLQLCTLKRDIGKPKLENLRELRFSEEEIRILVKKFPSFMCLFEERLQQNFKFLVEEWKLPRNVVLVHPVALSYSVEKRLKPRLQSLRALKMKNKSSKEAESYPPVHYMSMSEDYFHRNVTLNLFPLAYSIPIAPGGAKASRWNSWF